MKVNYKGEELDVAFGRYTYHDNTIGITLVGPIDTKSIVEVTSIVEDSYSTLKDPFIAVTQEDPELKDILVKHGIVEDNIYGEEFIGDGFASVMRLTGKAIQEADDQFFTFGYPAMKEEIV